MAVTCVDAERSTPTEPLGEVYWIEQPTRTRVVKRICRRCQDILWSRDYPTMVGIGDVYVVSPGGVGHDARETGDPETLCGIKADDDGWWWREY